MQCSICLECPEAALLVVVRSSNDFPLTGRRMLVSQSHVVCHGASEQKTVRFNQKTKLRVGFTINCYCNCHHCIPKILSMPQHNIVQCKIPQKFVTSFKMKHLQFSFCDVSSYFGFIQLFHVDSHQTTSVQSTAEKSFLSVSRVQNKLFTVRLPI